MRMIGNKTMFLDASAVPSFKLLAKFRTVFYDDASNIGLLMEKMGNASRNEAIAPFSVHNELTVMIEIIKACHYRL